MSPCTLDQAVSVTGSGGQVTLTRQNELKRASTSHFMTACCSAPVVECFRSSVCDVLRTWRFILTQRWTCLSLGVKGQCDREHGELTVRRDYKLVWKGFQNYLMTSAPIDEITLCCFWSSGCVSLHIQVVHLHNSLLSLVDHFSHFILFHSYL